MYIVHNTRNCRILYVRIFSFSKTYIINVSTADDRAEANAYPPKFPNENAECKKIGVGPQFERPVMLGVVLSLQIFFLVSFVDFFSFCPEYTQRNLFDIILN